MRVKCEYCGGVRRYSEDTTTACPGCGASLPEPKLPDPPPKQAGWDQQAHLLLQSSQQLQNQYANMGMQQTSLGMAQMLGSDTWMGMRGGGGK
jgi:hypothetical protein